MRFRTIALASSVVTMLACTDNSTPVENRRAAPDTPAASLATAPNEPGGLSLITDRPFNSKSTSSGTGSEGWSSIESGYADFAIASDAAAPQSPSNVAQITFPAGFVGNAAPATSEIAFAAGQRSLYASVWFKLSSNFVGGAFSSMNKIFDIAVNGTPRVNFVAHGTGSNALNPYVQLTSAADTRNWLAPVSGAAAIAKGVWQQAEISLTMNTPGAADGVIRVWLNRTKVIEYTNVQIVNATESDVFSKFQIQPLWGSQFDRVPSSQSISYDEVYATGSTSRSPSTTTTSPTPTPTPTPTPAPTASTGPVTNECSSMQAGWIFCDDFEQDRTAKYFEYDNAGGRFVRSSGNGVNGSTSMRAQYLQGQISAGSLHLAIGRTPSTYFKPADAGTANYRELYWRVYVKRQAGWTGDGPWKLTRAQIIAKSDWTQAMIAHFWSDQTNTKYLLADPASGTDASGNVITSGYNDFTNLRWLGGVRTDSTYDDNAHGGAWQCMEFHARLNDAGQSNAVQEMWVNGHLAERKSGFNWVGSYNAYGINNIFLEQYWNPGAAATEYRDLDNFVVSTQPIGCGGSTTTTSPTPAPAPTVAAVAVSPATSSILVGQTAQLTATSVDASGNVMTGQTITWKTSNAAVATISSTGVATGVSAGSVTITGWNGAYAGSATVTVSAPVAAPTLASISVSPASSSLTVGQTAQLSATDVDNTGKAMTGVTNTWSTGNSAVATVSASGLVTAVGAGSTTIKAASGSISGSASISVTVPTTSPTPTPTPSSGDFANEPAGFTMLTSRPFNTIARSCSDATAAEGWDPGEECAWSHISIVSDPTAPKSPNNVLQAWYPSGTTGGTIDATPGRIVKNFSASQQVYVSMWVKLSSNFVGNGTWTNKVFFIWINNGPDFFMSAEGAGTGALAPTGRLQGTMDTREKLPPNLVTSAVVQRGVWQHWEVLVKANTPGVANGEFHLWVNGQKVSEYKNVGYLGSGSSTTFMKMDVEPIWGGGGSTLTADQYMYFDHVYVSKP